MPKLISEKERCVRKERECVRCHSTIAVGDHAICRAVKTDGTIKNFYFCLPCIDRMKEERIAPQVIKVTIKLESRPWFNKCVMHLANMWDKAFGGGK